MSHSRKTSTGTEGAPFASRVKTATILCLTLPDLPWQHTSPMTLAASASGDAFSLFRAMTATQAWTVSCTSDQLKEAEEQLLKSWHSKGLREDPHEERNHWEM